MGYIPVEYGSLALGVISAISTALTLIWSVVNLFIIAVDLGKPRDTSYHDMLYEFFHGIAMWAAQVAFVILAVGSVIAFVFSVLLCVGVRKRRPGHVLAYFIYGSVVTGLSVSLSIIYLCDNSNQNPLPGIVGLIALAVYSLCLVMVFKTYRKLQQEAMFKNHIPLVENLSPYSLK